MTLWPILIRVAFLMGLTLLSFMLKANERIVVLVDDTPTYAPGPELQYILDVDRSLTWKTVESVSSARWESAQDTALSFGFTDANLWIKLIVENQASQNRHYLEVAAALLDELEIDVVIEGVSGVTKNHYELGDVKKFNERTVRDTKFVVPIVLEPQERAVVLMKVSTESAMQIPIRLYSQRAFFQEKLVSQGLYGAYFGIMVVMAVYNLFIFFSVRHTSYLYYAMMVFSCALFVAAIEGYAFQYLWPDSPGINAFFSALDHWCYGTIGRSFLDNIASA